MMAISSKVKQVIVIRRDLKMRRGKECAQASHASMMFLVNKLRFDRHEAKANIHFTEPELTWLTAKFTKVCVKVASEEELLEIHQAAVDAGIESHLVKDAGLTEFRGTPTLTCAAIGPDLTDKIDKITGHLILL